MLAWDDYRELAARCIELADESSEPSVAEALRALAADYLARGGNASAVATSRVCAGESSRAAGRFGTDPRSHANDPRARRLGPHEIVRVGLLAQPGVVPGRADADVADLDDGEQIRERRSIDH
jgi:hypothetical protein